MENEPAVGDDAWRGPQPAASPHSTPDPAPPPAARRGGARLAVVAAAALAVAAALFIGLAPRSTVITAAGAGGGRALAPLDTAADPRTGERTAPFSGFAVSVETVPPGALVTIAGVERGEAPVLAGIDCAPGERVEIAARRPPGRAATASTTCRADTLVKLTLRLGR